MNDVMKFDYIVKFVIGKVVVWCVVYFFVVIFVYIMFVFVFFLVFLGVDFWVSGLFYSFLDGFWV